MAHSSSHALSRRAFGRLAVAGLPVAGWAGAARLAAQRPNSVIDGVHIGVISSSFQGLSAAEIIPAMVKLGLSEVELQPGHAEALAGAPVAAAGGARAGGAAQPAVLDANGLLPRCAGLPMVLTPDPVAAVAQAAQGRGRGAGTPEQVEAQNRLRDWRAATTPATWAAVRRQFSDAGIAIPTLWYGLGFMGAATSDEDIDYAFRMAQGLGVTAMSGSSTIPIARRIAAAAEKYRMPWGGHTQDNIHDPDQFTTPEAYDRLLALSPFMRVCLDIGYFTAGGFDAVPFIRQHHARISDIHLKDRKRSRTFGGDITNNAVNNFPFGQGDSPIREVMQLLKKEQYPIPVTIEYDYSCRTTADSVTEVGRCFEYLKQSLRG